MYSFTLGWGACEALFCIDNRCARDVGTTATTTKRRRTVPDRAAFGAGAHRIPFKLCANNSPPNTQARARIAILMRTLHINTHKHSGHIHSIRNLLWILSRSRDCGALFRRNHVGSCARNNWPRHGASNEQNYVDVAVAVCGPHIGRV